MKKKIDANFVFSCNGDVKIHILDVATILTAHRMKIKMYDNAKREVTNLILELRGLHLIVLYSLMLIFSAI